MMCPEKQVFSTLRGAAEEAVTQLNEHGRHLRAYVCTVCDKYHLTSRPFDGEREITDEQVLRLAAAVGARRKEMVKS